MASDAMASTQSGSKRTRAERILMQIKSIDERDDERTSISKRISWILRQGASKVAVEQDAEKWVKFADLCQCEILKEFSQDTIWKVIVDFNGKKLRYEIEEKKGETRLRAYQRDERREQRKYSAPEGAPAVRSEGGHLRSDAQEFVPTAVPAATPGGAPSAGGAVAGSPAAMAQAQMAYFAAMQQMAMMSPMMNPMMNQMAQMQAAAAGKYQGRIKSFNDTKGFGFIECQQTFAQHARDVFLHKAQLGSLEVGNYVAFSCELNKQGMPQAKEVHLLPGMAAAAAAAALGKGKGKGKGEKGEKGGKGEKGANGEKGAKGEKKKKGKGKGSTVDIQFGPKIIKGTSS